jgi:hypothetical protein
MDLFANIVGIVVLLWIFIGPLVGYALAVRGWRFQSPMTRVDESHEEGV